MNSTSSEELLILPLRRGLISNEDFVKVEYALAYVTVAVSLAGVVTNSINIRTFIAMGLDDGMTVTLMGLAVSDLGYSFFSCIVGSANAIGVLERKHILKNLPIQPMYVFGVFSANFAFLFNQITCMTTTYLAIARCMCVAMPFQFKDFFTKSRSIIALVTFNLIAAATYVPVLSQMGVRRKFDPTVNRTRFVLWMSSKRSDFKDVVAVIHFFTLSLVSAIVVVICIAVMAKYLRESVKFRNMSTKGAEDEGVSGKSDGKLTGKELRVVQQIMVICIIYTVCKIPAVSVAVYRLVEEDFDVGQRLQNMYMVLGAIGVIMELVNSTTLFPVYYVYNSTFRSTFRSHCFSGRSLDNKMMKNGQ